MFDPKERELPFVQNDTERPDVLGDVWRKRNCLRAIATQRTAQEISRYVLYAGEIPLVLYRCFGNTEGTKTRADGRPEGVSRCRARRAHDAQSENDERD